MYVMGIDAGGTKTHCAVADQSGRLMGEGKGGPANHQICGIAVAKASLQEAVSGALHRAGVRLDEISYAVFGMAGADGEDDFAVLIPAVREIMGEIGFEVVHDGWIGFRSATEERAGVVSICGTGAGHAGQNREGQKLTLRNLDYITGNLGGGGDLVQAALHFTFRSEEGTADKTLLEEVIPGIFGVKTLEEVCDILKKEEMTREQEFQIPIAVFDLAHKGDSVCRRMISTMGYEEGRYAAAVIRRLHMEEDRIPVVMIGSLFHTKDPLLIDPFMEAVHKTAPDAYPLIPDTAPVTGAIALALEHMLQSR